jgi:hypothetical protein
MAGPCPAGDACTSVTQVCNPLSPDCPAGQSCRFGAGDLSSGQGSWSCL